MEARSFPLRDGAQRVELTGKHICFFTNQPLAELQRQQYSIQDMRILSDLGARVTVATSYDEIPWRCDLYFSWWAAGSLLPLVKARLTGRAIVVVAGGHDSVLCRDSVSGRPYGYLASPWYKKAAVRAALRFSTLVLPVSHYMVPHVRMLGARRVVVVHNSIDVERFRPSNDVRTFVTTVFNTDSGAASVKRGEIFLRSIPSILRRHPDQAFRVIGTKGDAQDHLDRLVRELGITESVAFVGPVDNAEMVHWMQRSRVYVQISDTETFGVSIAEAMSAGTPVVTSRAGSIPEVVGDCARFADHNDPAAVAEAVSDLLALGEQERERIGMAGRARIVEQFSYDRRKAAIATLLDELLR